MKKILLHTCCGPCFLGVWEDLGSKKFEVTNYFYNPNIWPQEEHEKRKENLEKITRELGTKLIVEDYTSGDHKDAVAELAEDFPARCPRCYEVRLRKVARYARDNGYDSFSTTLLVSPYQNHDAIRLIGEAIAKDLGVQFYYADWRPYYREGQSKAKVKDIYRQKYCGCKPSSEYR